MTTVLPPITLNIFGPNIGHGHSHSPHACAGPRDRPGRLFCSPRGIRTLSPGLCSITRTPPPLPKTYNNEWLSPSEAVRPKSRSPASSLTNSTMLNGADQPLQKHSLPVRPHTVERGVEGGSRNESHPDPQVDEPVQENDALGGVGSPHPTHPLPTQLVDDTPTEPFPSCQVTSPSTPQRGPHAHEPPYEPPYEHCPDSVSPAVQHAKEHQPRNSDASSAFVHSLKTASMSNASLSILQRSSCAARSSECPSYLNQGRFSTDSERPAPPVSVSEAALTRAVKRRWIIGELIATEESYIADLKALIYLYSTLLAPVASISTSIRLAIQKNVSDILHMHERMVEKMHRALYRAAARKWADTVSPAQLAASRLRQPYRAAPCTRTHCGQGHLPEGTIGAKERTPAPLPQGTADAAEVLDLVAIFDEQMSPLLLYEEYCANHGIITHELRKQTPVQWSTYEAGIESLAGILTAIDQKEQQKRKGLTVGDLLIKPIQRICKYPLLLSDLLKQLPLVDGFGAHEALRDVLQRLHEIVWAVDIATGNPFVRAQIQRRLLLQRRLDLRSMGIQSEAFRDLGYIQLCGALHITYQTTSAVEGHYALCALFDHHLVLAIPGRADCTCDLFAVINLVDLKIEPATGGKGLQCQSGLYTFKLCFAARGTIFELLLSACSPVEEEEWVSALSNSPQPHAQQDGLISSFPTQHYLDLKPAGRAFMAVSSPSEMHQPSVQRAATAANRPPTCQVILRNTYNPQALHGFRSSSSTHMNRSQSQVSVSKIVVLAPKRSERTRLEASLSDIWTRDRLPFPGMIANKGSQILRASAGSLVRKLSFASIQGSLSRRSASITVSSQRSYDVLSHDKTESAAFVVRRKSFEDRTPIRGTRPKDIPELDTMDNVIGRMIGGGSFGSKRLSFSSGEKKGGKITQVRRRASSLQFGPEDPAAILYGDDDKLTEAINAKEAGISGQARFGKSVAHGDNDSRGTRWSKPLSRLKQIGAEGFKNMMYHSR